MKLPFLLIFLISISAHAQRVSIKEIKLKPNPKFYNVKDSTIIYPIIISKYPKTNKQINDKIRNEILGPNEKNISLKKGLEVLINDGLIDLSYEITFNKNDILSLNIYAE